MIDEVKKRYAVVRDGSEARFTKWHPDFQTAKEEAERLCRKERTPFIIIKEIAVCEIGDLPVRWIGGDK